MINNNTNNTVIEPISCELSENMKAYVEMLEWNEQVFREYVKVVLPLTLNEE